MRYKLIFSICLCALSLNGISQHKNGEELQYLTAAWKGERFADGRPRVSDQLIERAKKIGIEEAWQILNNEGYKNQFEGNWKMVHDNVPVVGRAVTARFIPSRPDRNNKSRPGERKRAGRATPMPGP
jgi:hypothetical protein